MKQKIISGISILSIAVLAATNVSISTKTNVLSNISLANVEALADSETPTYSCPDGGYECLRVLTPGGVKIYHKGN